MKRSNTLLWILLIVVAGLVLWLISTGQLESTAGLFVNGFWDFIENILRPLSRR